MDAREFLTTTTELKERYGARALEAGGGAASLLAQRRQPIPSEPCDIIVGKATRRNTSPVLLSLMTSWKTDGSWMIAVCWPCQTRRGVVVLAPSPESCPHSQVNDGGVQEAVASTGVHFQDHSRRNISTRLEVHVATPHPKKSVSSVQIGHPKVSAVAKTGQSSGSRRSSRWRASASKSP